MPSSDVSIPLVSALGGSLIGSASVPLGGWWSDRRHEAATRRRDSRERRIVELTAFHDAADRYAGAVRTGVMALWGATVEGTDEQEVIAQMAASLDEARRRELWIRDAGVTAALEAIRTAYAGAASRAHRSEASREGVSRHERFLQLMQTNELDIIEARTKALRDHVRRLLDEVDPVE